MARGFAMRLMHLGRRVYHVGDVITPAIRRGDLLVLCTRTGRSPVLVLLHRHRAPRAAPASRWSPPTAKSPVARRADAVLAIDEPPRRAAPAAQRRRPPLGSLFEQALLVVLDQVVVDLMERAGLDEPDLARIHTTFE